MALTSDQADQEVDEQAETIRSSGADAKIRFAGQEALAAKSQRVRVEHLSATAGQSITSPELGAFPASPGPVNPASGNNPPTPINEGAKAEPRPSRARILAALIEAKGNVSEAARQLGVHRTQLRRDIAHHGIDPNRLRAI